jgi:hypothetical protein
MSTIGGHLFVHGGSMLRSTEGMTNSLSESKDALSSPPELGMLEVHRQPITLAERRREVVVGPHYEVIVDDRL